MSEFLNILQNRRSCYNLTSKTTLPDAQLLELIETAVKHTPSAFNSQTSRVVLLLNEQHAKLWNIVLNQLKARVPAANFEPTRQKVAGFAVGYGTILYLEEQDTIASLQKQFPLYADNFPTWSQQASGMLQLVLWTALADEGLGASLQHYNPIIDADIAAAFSLPSNWKLVAQMPFGKPGATADEKEFMPIENRVKVLGEK